VVVLGSGPGRIVDVVEVDLGDERELTVKRAPAFLALRSSIEDTVRAPTMPGWPPPADCSG
jgi:NitT/TauT family transport system ATP-binding protein